MANKPKKLSESYIEKAVSKWAEAQGWIAYKWTSPNNRGVPDRLFFKGGRLVIIEFKAPGKRPTKLQEFVHRKLKLEGGFEVLVVDSIEGGRDALRE